MKDEELVLYFNEHRLKKLEEYLLKDGSSAEHELQKLLCGLYESTVPERERMEIEARIELETENESAAREAARRFAVVHLHEGDDDFFFTTETCDDFYSISSRYRSRMKADIGEYTLDSIAQSSFGGCQEINGMTFSVLCDAMPNDQRITALVEFDFDNDIIILMHFRMAMLAYHPAVRFFKIQTAIHRAAVWAYHIILFHLCSSVLYINYGNSVNIIELDDLIIEFQFPIEAFHIYAEVGSLLFAHIRSSCPVRDPAVNTIIHGSNLMSREFKNNILPTATLFRFKRTIQKCGNKGVLHIAKRH